MEETVYTVETVTRVVELVIDNDEYITKFARLQLALTREPSKRLYLTNRAEKLYYEWVPSEYVDRYFVLTARLKKNNVIKLRLKTSVEPRSLATRSVNSDVALCWVECKTLVKPNPLNISCTLEPLEAGTAIVCETEYLNGNKEWYIRTMLNKYKVKLLENKKDIVLFYMEDSRTLAKTFLFRMKLSEAKAIVIKQELLSYLPRNNRLLFEPLMNQAVDTAIYDELTETGDFNSERYRNLIIQSDSLLYERGNITDNDVYNILTNIYKEYEDFVFPVTITVHV